MPQIYKPTGRVPDDPRLGRHIPPDYDHVRKYGYAAVLAVPVTRVEHVLLLPRWHKTHDQGQTGSCVGHGTAMERAITNTAQNRLLRLLTPTVRYDPLDLWDQAKLADGDPETNPGDNNGTTVRAAYDVLRKRGARRIATNGIHVINGNPVITDKHEKAASITEGILTNRWATTVDEMRSAIKTGNPVTIGVDWYEGFDTPERITFSGYRKSEYRISISGKVRGGHCVCVYGASDHRGAFLIKNSWGTYPVVWLSYEDMGKLLAAGGEATLQADR